MPAISQCPKCDAAVSLPQGADPQSLVRCPLCDESYLLQAALDIAPPELIVLGGSTAAGADASDVETAGDIEVEAPSAELAVNFDFGAEQTPANVSLPDDLAHRESDELDRYAETYHSKHRPRLLAKQIVGVLLGGLLGLAIGYVALLWIGGPQKDFLQLGERLPAVLLPKSFHPFDDPDAPP